VSVQAPSRPPKAHKKTGEVAQFLANDVEKVRTRKRLQGRDPKGLRFDHPALLRRERSDRTIRNIPVQ